MNRIIQFIALFCLSAGISAQTISTGDIIFQKKNATGPYTIVPLTPEANKAVGFDGSGNLDAITVGAGSVTSVALTLPTAIFDVAGSPVTTSGGFTVTLDTQAANTVFAGPATGAAAAPAFRALVVADMEPAGASGQVQFNNAGALGADAGFSYTSGGATLGQENIQAGQLTLYDEVGTASGSILFHDQAGGNLVQLTTSGITDTRTITFPDASGALVLNDNTATLTGKTISGSNNTISNIAIGSAVSGLGTGVATFLGTPSSANLASALTDETGSGVAVFATSPALETPALGVATATSINGLTLTSSTGTLTITNGKTFSASNTLTLAGTDGSTLNIGTGGTLGTAAYTAATAYTSSAVVPSTAPSAGQILVGNAGGTAYAPVTTSGDVTISSAGAMTIADAAVTNAKAADMAQATLKGRAAGAGTGDPTDLTANQVSEVLDGATDPFARTSTLQSSPVLLATVNASSSATVEFTTELTSAYRRYQVVIDGLSPATDATDFKMRVSDDGGSTWKSTGSYMTTLESDSMHFPPDDRDFTSQTAICLNSTFTFYHMSNVAGENGFFTIDISDPSTSRAVLIKWTGAYTADDPGTTPFIGNYGVGFWGGSQMAVTGIQFFFSSGNIAAGRFRLYGMP